MKKTIATVFFALAAITALIVINPAQAKAVDIQAQAAIVMCFETGDILFERDIHTPRVPASMTKAMTAFVVYEQIAAGNLTPDTRVRISANASRIAGDANMQGAPFPLAAGSYHTVDMLLHLAMLPSSNGACVALAEHISGTEAAFATLMNETAASIGMFSEFTNAHGALPHYTNAYSLAVLMRTFIERHPDILRITGAPSVMFGGSARNNTNHFINGQRPFAGADGFRTGTTREAGWCLMSTAYRNGRRVIVVVMNAPNNDRRYGDSATLLELGFTELARRDAAREAAARALARTFIDIELNGQAIEFGATPRLVAGRALAPAADLFEALGANITETDDRIIATSEDWTVTLIEGSNTMIVARNEYTVMGEVSNAYLLDIPPQVIDGVLFVPVRAVAVDVMGMGVAWDGAAMTASIFADAD